MKVCLWQEPSALIKYLPGTEENPWLLRCEPPPRPHAVSQTDHVRRPRSFATSHRDAQWKRGRVCMVWGFPPHYAVLRCIQLGQLISTREICPTYSPPHKGDRSFYLVVVPSIVDDVVSVPLDVPIRKETPKRDFW
ncbi:hypothetical protein BRADI_1g48824v3 [Brachypodium distachyon]|uniref:Uncharacterized protein n=1 Tax=Brachypodium distachyon TaxID=15368 RepID=A0A2K2DQE0_BRADI|nr:hypothetical protein BRADI_1g48824v3 [Brachypodium distachyon]